MDSQNVFLLVCFDLLLVVFFYCPPSMNKLLLTIPITQVISFDRCLQVPVLQFIGKNIPSNLVLILFKPRTVYYLILLLFSDTSIKSSA